MAIELHLLLRQRQRFAGGNADHQFDEIEAGDAFGDGVFHLEAGIHFKEVEAAISPGDELHRAGAEIADVAGQGDGLFAHRLAHFRRDERGGGFFHHLLVAALDRTIALVQIEDVALLVADQLDFDVARLFDELLDEHAVITKAGQCFAADAVKAFAHVSFAPRQAHALAAAAGRSLHHHRIADASSDFDRVFGAGDFTDKAGDDADAGGLCAALALDLVAHGGDGGGRWADEGDAGGAERFDEAGAFRQEAIAGVDSFGACRLAGGDDLVGDQIGFGSWRRADVHGLIGFAHMQGLGIGIGIDGHCLDAHRAGRTDHAAGNLTAVGNQDFREQGVWLPSARMIAP